MPQKLFTVKEVLKTLNLKSKTSLYLRQDRAGVTPKAGTVGKTRVKQNFYTAQDIEKMKKFHDPRKPRGPHHQTKKKGAS